MRDTDDVHGSYHDYCNRSSVGLNCIPFLGVFSKLPVCPSAENNWAPAGWIFIKFDSGIFFVNLSTKFKFHRYLTRIMVTSLEDPYKFVIMSL